jgi:hypothetical protein
VIAHFVPTPTETAHTISAAGYILAASGTLALFCILCSLALDRYESWRQRRIAAKQAEREALIAEREIDAYYERSLAAASQIGPWPPGRRG